MLKKILVVIGTLIVLFFAGFVYTHQQIIDYFNPTIHETISYARVPKNKSTYHQVRIIDPKTGKELPYKLKEVGGYLPDKQYIKIDHKGQYVKQITYISKHQFNQITK